MQRALIIIGIVVLMLAPIALLVFRHPVVSTYLRTTLRLPSKGQVSEQYTAASEVPETTVKIIDTSYLDYVAVNLGIFKDQAIVDPQIYRGNQTATQRYTVSRVQFTLVDDLDSFVYGASGKNGFAAKGDYRVVDDALEVFISLDVDQVQTNAINRHYAAEEVFLKTVFTTLLYAHGLTSPQETAKFLSELRSDMEQYLETGIFPWPIQIVET